MHSITNLKFWKKCTKRFSKKKLKPAESSCLYNNPKGDTNSVFTTEISFQCGSGYSIDSLEEKSFTDIKLVNDDQFNNEVDLLSKSSGNFEKKSRSLDRIYPHSLQSDSSFSRDSLRSSSLSLDSLCKYMKENTRNLNESVTSRTIEKTQFSDNTYRCTSLSHYPFRDRSQSVDNSYKFNKSLINIPNNSFTNAESLCKSIVIASNSNDGLTKIEALSIDSLESRSNNRLSSVNFLNQYISKDSLYNSKHDQEYDTNSYKIKSISVGILHKTKYFHDVINDRGILNQMKNTPKGIQNNNKNVNKHKNISGRGIKLTPRPYSANSLGNILKQSKYRCQGLKMSIDSLNGSHSFDNVSTINSEGCFSIDSLLSPEVVQSKSVADVPTSGIKLNHISGQQLDLNTNSVIMVKEIMNLSYHHTKKSFSIDSLDTYSTDLIKPSKPESISPDSLNDF